MTETDPKSSSYFHANWWLALLGNILGILLASSAYVVYSHTTQDLPVSVTFFWFSLFAFTALLFFPRKFTFTQAVWGEIHPGETLRGWKHAFKEGDRRSILIAGICYSLHFGFLLTCLHQNEVGVVVTVLVIFLLGPPLATLFAEKILGDSFHKGWWFLGTLLAITGVGLYRFTGTSGQPLSLALNTVFWLSLMGTICGVTNKIYRAKYRRALDKRDIKAHDILSVQMMAVPLAIIWVLVTEPTGLSIFLAPTWEQYLALLYLGMVPTAASMTLVNHGQDVLGMALSEAISNLRPFAALVIEMIPLAWFYASHEHLSLPHYAGIGVALIGVILITLLAESKPGDEKEPAE